MTGAGFTLAVAILVVSTLGIDAGLAGFALSFSLQFAAAINSTLRFYTSCELDMNAAERVIEYVNLKTESQDGADVPAAWPSEGRVTVTDLVVGYADDLPAVLKGLTFSVEGGQRVGIVGRTGAGKSSLALALFRFLDARQGSVTIDGIDISKIKLFDLRSRLAIIPQDPTIFSGTYLALQSPDLTNKPRHRAIQSRPLQRIHR
jgi:ABC-type multidrug transport system fused ATPase/permease subunit